jgi:hypothetical protein
LANIRCAVIILRGRIESPVVAVRALRAIALGGAGDAIAIGAFQVAGAATETDLIAGLAAGAEGGGGAVDAVGVDEGAVQLALVHC